MNKLYVCFGDTKKQKQTNKLYTSGCLTEKKIDLYKNRKRTIGYYRVSYIYGWKINKKIQFATPKDYWIQRSLREHPLMMSLLWVGR